MPSSRRLILASQSPRRKALLSEAGFSFSVLSPLLNETPNPSEMPREYVARLAREKAESAEKLSDDADCVILAADTEVALDARIFGKPANTAAACQMLSMLSGKTHLVMTGYCALVLPLREMHSGVAESRVTFRVLSDFEIAEYIQGGEPMDKAGAYAIQGGAAGFVTRVEGALDNVMGLPMAEVAPLIKKLLSYRAS